MPFYVKYVDKEGNTIVEELLECENRGEAAEKLDGFRALSEDGQVSLTSKESTLAQWQKWFNIEKQITPMSSKER